MGGWLYKPHSQICFLFRVIFMRVIIHPNWVWECHFETKKAVRRCCTELTPPIFFQEGKKGHGRTNTEHNRRKNRHYGQKEGRKETGEQTGGRKLGRKAGRQAGRKDEQKKGHGAGSCP